MKTTQQRAEAAAKEIHREFSGEWYESIPLPRKEQYTGLFNCAEAKRNELAAIIARHYAGMDALRDAAERAVNWMTQDLEARRLIVQSLGADEQSEAYLASVENEITSLRAALLDMEGKAIPSASPASCDQR